MLFVLVPFVDWLRKIPEDTTSANQQSVLVWSVPIAIRNSVKEGVTFLIWEL